MSEIRPALTPEEWASREVNRKLTDSGGWPLSCQPIALGEDAISIGPPEYAPSMHVPAEYLHAIAALALHDQPFGFRHKDVRLLREAVYNVPDGWSGNPWMDELADRIAALLPPESGA
jgi:hypothetical protein